MAGKKSDKRRWVRGVRTDSTFPPQGLFSKDARTIARTMASQEVSPKGIGSVIRMIPFFINRGRQELAGRAEGGARESEEVPPGEGPQGGIIIVRGRHDHAFH
jgi:hypothetical protein